MKIMNKVARRFGYVPVAEAVQMQKEAREAALQSAAFDRAILRRVERERDEQAVERAAIVRDANANVRVVGVLLDELAARRATGGIAA